MVLVLDSNTSLVRISTRTSKVCGGGAETLCFGRPQIARAIVSLGLDNPEGASAFVVTHVKRKIFGQPDYAGVEAAFESVCCDEG